MVSVDPSEDSEEFLTILGKKMGKLVKGGDAESWPKVAATFNKGYMYDI